MSVEDRLPLLLDLELPALLRILHLVQDVGSAARAGQHVVGICERLVVLKVKAEGVRGGRAREPGRAGGLGLRQSEAGQTQRWGGGGAEDSRGRRNMGYVEHEVTIPSSVFLKEQKPRQGQWSSALEISLSW